MNVRFVRPIVRALPVAVLALLGATLPASLLAGPLNPPAGAIASTNKTLAEIEPRKAVSAANTPGDATCEFIITQPGSYYLAGDVTTAKPTVIRIEASGVNMDLRGFNVSSTNTGSYELISATNAANLNIHDGRLAGPTGVNGFGITCDSDQTTVRRVAIACGGRQIVTTTNSVIEDVTVTTNTIGAFAVNCGKGAQLRRVVVHGAAGISVTEGSIVEGCTVRNSRSAGISTFFNCVVSGCTVMASAGHGFSIADGSTVSNCTSSQNAGTGIAATSYCTVTGCVSTQNQGGGIFVSQGSRVSNCTAGNNAQDGIELNDGSTVSDCNVRSNTSNGIIISSHCVVTGNNCFSNGSGAGSGAGIFASGANNRIEGNDCSLNDRGVEVSFFKNMVIRCTCSGNTTNWVIGAGNICGPFLDRTATGAAGFSGNAGPSSLGTTDPNANFTY